MNSILESIFKNIYFWGLLGGILASLFAQMELHSIKKINVGEAERILSGIMAQSGLRVLAAVAVLFLAFRSGIAEGFSCLITFFIVRWIWLYVIVKKNNKLGREK